MVCYAHLASRADGMGLSFHVAASFCAPCFPVNTARRKKNAKKLADPRPIAAIGAMGCFADTSGCTLLKTRKEGIGLSLSLISMPRSSKAFDGVVGSAGFAIVLYTIIIKVATFPLQQPALRTSALMQLLSPQTDEIERRYPLDEEGRGRTLRELYGKVGLNPFAAFLPILFQLPVFIALFRAIGKLASQDEHFKEGRKTVGCCRVAEVCRHRSVRFARLQPRRQEPFLWIPSLAGPVASGRRAVVSASAIVVLGCHPALYL